MPNDGLLTDEEFAVLTTAFTLGALRLPPRLPMWRLSRPALAWPDTLPPPANRPDDAALENAGPAVEAPAAPLPILGGWHDSSLDLKLGLTVQDLGPVEWLDELDGAFPAC
ncbi:MAG: hypothetical protein IV094_19880 [Vitreoscilla sp.]|nr:hypothetical protein [Vitreoscilla sp.]